MSGGPDAHRASLWPYARKAYRHGSLLIRSRLRTGAACQSTLPFTEGMARVLARRSSLLTTAEYAQIDLVCIRCELHAEDPSNTSSDPGVVTEYLVRDRDRFEWVSRGTYRAKPDPRQPES